MESEKNVSPSENNRDGRYVDERTRDKIHKHLSDPNSRITEEDIANVNTDIFKRPDEEFTDEALNNNKTTETEDSGKKAPNTWDLLEE